MARKARVPWDFVIRALVLVLVVTGLMVTYLWLVQRRLIYLPTQEVPPISWVLPGAEEVAFQTEDGLALAGWFLPSGSSPGPAILVFNGNAGNRAGRAALAQALVGEGYSVLLFDYRGYGGNPGRPTEEGLMADARAARTWLVSRGEVDPARVAFFGESLGAAVAISLAVQEPPAALVLRSPFTGLAEMGRLHYPYLPVGLLLRDRFASLERVGDLETPVLVIAGEDDRIVPPVHSRRIYDAAPSPKHWVSIPGAGHNDPDLFTGGRLMGEVSAFLARHVR